MNLVDLFCDLEMRSVKKYSSKVLHTNYVDGPWQCLVLTNTTQAQPSSKAGDPWSYAYSFFQIDGLLRLVTGNMQIPFGGKQVSYLSLPEEMKALDCWKCPLFFGEVHYILNEDVTLSIRMILDFLVFVG